MQLREHLIGAVVLCSVTIATPAVAGVAPYVRVAYGGYQLKMPEGNALISQNEAALQAAGVPASFEPVPPAYGPGASAGFWITPVLRVGAMYSYSHSTGSYRAHAPGQVDYADDLDFRMSEIGGEAALRFRSLGGLTLGGSIGRGSATMTEAYAVEDATSQHYENSVANRTRTTYGAFAGLDRENPDGLAATIQIGYRFRDMGRIPGQITISDGSSETTLATETIPLDYSGTYIMFSIGYDFGR